VIQPPEHSGNPISSHLVATQENLEKGMVNFALRKVSLSYFEWFFNMSQNLHGTDGFTSALKEGVMRIFIAFKNSSPLAGFEPANLESNCKNANH
jgi:hypothetical protein